MSANDPIADIAKLIMQCVGRSGREIKILACALLLTGCSSEKSDCDALVVENIHFSELVERFPVRMGTNTKATDWVDSSQFETDSLYVQRPALQDGMAYFETRKSESGETIFLFEPFAVTDILIGLSTDKNNTRVLVIGVL